MVAAPVDATQQPSSFSWLSHQSQSQGQQFGVGAAVAAGQQYNSQSSQPQTRFFLLKQNQKKPPNKPHPPPKKKSTSLPKIPQKRTLLYQKPPEKSRILKIPQKRPLPYQKAVSFYFIDLKTIANK
jgi:hypothetical protein